MEFSEVKSKYIKKKIKNKDKNRKKASSLFYSFSGMPWFRGEQIINGSPFVKPKFGLRKTPSYTDPYMATGAGVLVLGPCTPDSGCRYIFSQPMKKLPYTLNEKTRIDTVPIYYN